jgi:hypothetical protein
MSVHKSKSIQLISTSAMLFKNSHTPLRHKLSNFELSDRNVISFQKLFII